VNVVRLRKNYARDLTICSAEGCGRSSTWCAPCPDCGELVAGCVVHVAAMMSERAIPPRN